MDIDPDPIKTHCQLPPRSRIVLESTPVSMGSRLPGVKLPRQSTAFQPVVTYDLTGIGLAPAIRLRCDRYEPRGPLSDSQMTTVFPMPLTRTSPQMGEGTEEVIFELFLNASD